MTTGASGGEKRHSPGRRSWARVEAELGQSFPSGIAEQQAKCVNPARGSGVEGRGWSRAELYLHRCWDSGNNGDRGFAG